MIKKITILMCMLAFVCGPAYAVKVFPNPWIPANNSGRHGNLGTDIIFDGVPDTGGSIYIYNSTGELVRKISWNAGVPRAYWDGKNDRSEYVASGVYIWVMKESGTKTGKIVVIR